MWFMGGLPPTLLSTTDIAAVKDMEDHEISGLSVSYAP